MFLTCPCRGWSGLRWSARAILACFPLLVGAQPEKVPLELFAAPEGLEVTLWSQSPQLFNPTNMDIDHAGRIWVAEGANYRFSRGRQPEGDRIQVIEDSDGDGRADRSWTFVQEPELVAPMGVAVIDNKIYVSNAPDLIVYTDVDRDLVYDPAVDKREVLLTGFNGLNHDHALHSVTYGPDGLLYFNHGNSGALVTDRSGRTFRVGSAYDGLLTGDSAPLYGIMPIRYSGAASDDGHVYVGGFAMRMQPDATELEVIGFNFRNSYEQTVTSFGEVFQNDNDDPPACRTTHLIEYGNTGWFSRDGTRYWNADRRPGQSVPTAQWRQEDPGVIPAGDVYGAGAPTGIVFYEGDALGEEWRGLLLSCDAARNVVFGYKPQPRGASYDLDRILFLTTNVDEELAGTDALHGKTSEDLKTYFRPSDIAVGPDGALYVADWFDPRVGGHQDLDQGASGAIYRIAPKGFKSIVPQLDLETTEGQIEALKSPAVNVRALGFERLRVQGEAVVKPVSQLLEDDNRYVRARAIWLLAQLGQAGVKRVEALLKHSDPAFRGTAFQALRRVKEDNAVAYAEKLARDPSAAVRRMVAVAMRDIPFSASGPVLIALAEGYDGSDRAYLEAWGIGCTGKEAEIFSALVEDESASSPTDWSDAFSGLAWRLTPAVLAKAFAERAVSESLSEAQRVEAITALGFIATKEAADLMLDLIDRSDGLAQEHARWWVLNYRNTRWKGFGLNEALKEKGLYDPSKIVVSGSIIPAPDKEKRIASEQAMALQGDPQAGALKASVCYSCHVVGDNGVEYGPTLDGFARRQATEVLVNAIVDPSLDIAHGYDGREVVLKDGVVIHGIIESYADPLIIRSMGGNRQMVPQERIERVNWYGRSLMLSADQLGLNAQDVADIVAYLKTQ